MKLVVASSIIFLSGCCAFSTQSKFESSQDYWVGHQLAEPWFTHMVESSESSVSLEGGDVEYFYQHGECRFTRVINSNTKTFKSWDYKENPEFCRISSCGPW